MLICAVHLNVGGEFFHVRGQTASWKLRLCRMLVGHACAPQSGTPAPPGPARPCTVSHCGSLSSPYCRPLRPEGKPPRGSETWGRGTSAPSERLR